MNVITVFIQIGNSDDKLSQGRWSEFVGDVEFVLLNLPKHFAGLSAGDKPWQNACWCIEIPLDQRDVVRAQLRTVARDYGQESIAWSEAQTEFLFAAPSGGPTGGTPEPTDG